MWKCNKWNRLYIWEKTQLPKLEGGKWKMSKNKVEEIARIIRINY